MSQDIVADVLNQMMNAKKAGKKSIRVSRHSKTLLGVLAIGKLRGYIASYKVEGRELEIEFGKINFCIAIKPRYVIKNHMIDKYVRRYLPSKDLGVIIITTSQGLMTHHTAIEKKLGGSIIAYFY